MHLKEYPLADRYGKWHVLGNTAFGVPIGRGGEHCYYAVCQCECGEVVPVRVRALRTGRSNSCGCDKTEKRIAAATKAKITHGHCVDGFAWLVSRAWGQQWRCTDPSCPYYLNYGGRGIRFEFDSIGDAVAYYRSLPDCSKELQIDRIDNDGHYEPGNVRFVTQQENLKNRRPPRKRKLVS